MELTRDNLIKVIKVIDECIDEHQGAKSDMIADTVMKMIKSQPSGLIDIWLGECQNFIDVAEMKPMDPEVEQLLEDNIDDLLA